MKRFSRLAVLAMVTMLAFASVATAAEGKKKNAGAKKGAKVSAAAQGVADIKLASDLAAYARRAKNPAAMLVAAQIMKNTPVRDAAAKKNGAKAGAAAAKRFVTPETLLAEAKTMAGGNTDLVAMIDTEATLAATRGAANGPQRIYENVLAGRTDVFQIKFIGGEKAQVGVVGDGDADIDLYIYDENDNLIESDADRTSACIAEWTPSWTGTFKVKIKNIGSVRSDYLLVTN